MSEAETELKSLININLLKRGISVDLDLFIEAGSGRVSISSSSFQTFPVIFKSINVRDFVTSITFFENEMNQNQLCEFSIDVYLDCATFNSVDNKTVKLFEIKGNFTLDNGSLYNIVID